MRKIIKFSILLSFFLCSCSTIPKFSGNGDLCGLIVDEQNKPVKDFAVYCKNKGFVNMAVFTNESGIFVFHNIPSGMYEVSGYKEGFEKLSSTEYFFSDRGKIFCCQVNGVDSILDQVEKLYLLKDYEGGIKLLDSVCVKKSSNEEKVVLYFKKIISEKMNKEGVYEENDDGNV